MGKVEGARKELKAACEAGLRAFWGRLEGFPGG